MKRIILYGVKWYLKVGLFFYYRRLEVKGKQNIPQQTATLVLGNHQNALIDPLLLAVQFDDYAHYLTRAGVFQKPVVSRFLSFFNMLPVYRISDGWNTITKNNAIFSTCKTLLGKQQKVVLFPEGSHSLVRRVRPLSKGFTRIVLDTVATYPELNLVLLPVGFNYQNAEDFPDSARVYYGKPIAVKEVLQHKTDTPVSALKTAVYQALTQITTHIPEEDYASTIARLHALQVDFLNPTAVNACIANPSRRCTATVKKRVWQGYLKYPLYVNLLFPVLFWRGYVKPKIQDAAFTATFRFAVSVILIPLWLLLVSGFVCIFWGLLPAASYLFISVLLMLLYVKA
ncbi:MAG TPA: 1-acyl-sn-glycerol-3-phosphate acyltransferase [Flavobacteriaceae bacterium]|nr:1-acyl-sn-glycerol-3-phosphate acyltransferase [Flavobacteriaceae bacterium]